MLDEGVLVHHAVDVAACDVTANLTVIEERRRKIGKLRN